jgi:hypothetical protein
MFVFRIFLVSLIFEGKAGANPSNTPFGTPPFVHTPGLAHKYYTCLKTLQLEKHTSLFCPERIVLALNKVVMAKRSSFFSKRQ